jgi:hypothetical protein
MAAKREKSGRGKSGRGKDGRGKDGHGKDGHGKDGHGKDGHGEDGHGKDGHGKQTKRGGSCTPAPHVLRRDGRYLASLISLSRLKSLSYSATISARSAV